MPWHPNDEDQAWTVVGPRKRNNREGRTRDRYNRREQDWNSRSHLQEQWVRPGPDTHRAFSPSSYASATRRGLAPDREPSPYIPAWRRDPRHRDQRRPQIHHSRERWEPREAHHHPDDGRGQRDYEREYPPLHRGYEPSREDHWAPRARTPPRRGHTPPRVTYDHRPQEPQRHSPPRGDYQPSHQPRNNWQQRTRQGPQQKPDQGRTQRHKARPTNQHHSAGGQRRHDVPADGPQQTDTDFVRQVRILSRLIKARHHLSKLQSGEPPAIKKLREHLTEIIKPAAPGDITLTLIKSNADNWAHTTMQILTDHYESLLIQVRTDLTNETTSDMNAPFDVAAKWCRRSLGRRLQPSTIDHAHRILQDTIQDASLLLWENNPPHASPTAADIQRLLDEERALTTSRTQTDRPTNPLPPRPRRQHPTQQQQQDNAEPPAPTTIVVTADVHHPSTPRPPPETNRVEPVIQTQIQTTSPILDSQDEDEDMIPDTQLDPFSDHSQNGVPQLTLQPLPHNDVNTVSMNLTFTPPNKTVITGDGLIDTTTETHLGPKHQKSTLPHFTPLNIPNNDQSGPLLRTRRLPSSLEPQPSDTATDQNRVVRRKHTNVK